MMTKRTKLPKLEGIDLPWRTDRPGPGLLIRLAPAEPTLDQAHVLLCLFVTPEEADRRCKAFATQIIEPYLQDQRLEVDAGVVIDWLEAVWLAHWDAIRGIPQPWRWKNRSLPRDQ